MRDRFQAKVYSAVYRGRVFSQIADKLYPKRKSKQDYGLIATKQDCQEYFKQFAWAKQVIIEIPEPNVVNVTVAVPLRIYLLAQIQGHRSPLLKAAEGFGFRMVIGVLWNVKFCWKQKAQ